MSKEERLKYIARLAVKAMATQHSVNGLRDIVERIEFLAEYPDSFIEANRCRILNGVE